MEVIEALEVDVIKLRDKANYRIERMKRYRELKHPKYNEFDNGRVWGAYQAYNTMLGKIRDLKSK